jgi:predicted DNA-binding transcriptional regulator YafY
MKNDRLFNILYILLNKRVVTAKELAERFEVSTRTIYRDIETLIKARVPIYTDKGTGGGIKLIDEYVLDQSIISSDEKNDIILALDMLRATEYSNTSETINKLSILFGSNNVDHIDIDLSDFNRNNQRDIFESIKKSISTCYTVLIDYKSYNQDEMTREICPLKLVFKKQRWYLIAFCKLRNDIRTFRISRIQNLNITNEKFNKEDYPIEDYSIGFGTSNDLITIKLTLKKDCMNRVEEEFLGNYINNDDNIVVIFESAEDRYLFSYLLSYIDNIIDIEPKDIKEILKEKVKEFLLI